MIDLLNFEVSHPQYPAMIVISAHDLPSDDARSEVRYIFTLVSSKCVLEASTISIKANAYS